MKRIVLAGLGLFLFLFSFSQSKKYPSLLWEISGNGLKKPSYLYGTMHVSNKLAFHLTDTFFVALKSADVVGLESSPDTWMKELYADQTNSSGMNSYLGGQYFNSYGNFYSGFSPDAPTKEIYERCLSTDPALADHLLYRYGFTNENFEESTYLDLFIFQSARKMQKPVASLEDVMRSEELYALSTMPDEDADYSDYDYHDRYSLQDRIEDAYRNGDLDLMDSLTYISNPSKNFRHYLINERNKIFVHSMDSIMRKGSLFTGVGAAHLPGDSGVIMMLRNMGYKVRPVVAKVTKKSVKQMDELQQLKAPVTLTSFISNDSDFVMDSPGKMYPQSTYDGMEMQFYPEMVNGTYYMVRTVVTYAGLRGISRKDMIKQVDSLLYESIPGKITNKEEITAGNGFPGIELSNLTKRGDVQRYRIFAGDNLLYVFKLASTGHYLDGKDGDRIMNSIRFLAPKQAGWEKVNINGKGVVVEMPAGVERLSGSGNERSREKFTVASTGADSSMYFLEARWLDDHDYIEEDTFELRMMAESFYKKLPFEFISGKLGSYAGYPSYDVSLNSKAGKMLYVRCVLKGPAYYLLACETKGAMTPDRFFSSLQFTKPDYAGKLKEYKDTAMKFKVNVMMEEKKGDDRWDKFRKSITSMRYGKYPKSKMRRYYDSHSFDYDAPTTMEFTSPLSDEKVLLYYTAFNEFYTSQDKEEFWKRDWMGMIVKKERKELNGTTVMNVKLGDTASTRQILIKYILKDNRMYSLYACIDSIAGPGEFVRSVFDSFEVLPDTSGVDIFSNKEEKFFRYLNSKDSTLLDKALSYEYEFKFSDKHAGDLLNYVRSDAFLKNDFNTRMSFYQKLGALHHPGIVEFLSAKYKESSDSASVQFWVLHALSEQKTASAYSAISDLLNTETPLTSDKERISDLFGTFYDSLKLSSALFPSFFELLRYPEYKPYVLDLLVTLKDSGLVKPETYASQKSFFIKDANEELKRSLADNKYSNTNYDALYSMNYQKKLLKNYKSLLTGYSKTMFDQLYGNGFVTNGDVLYDYSALLVPYYAEPNAQKFYDRIFRAGSSDFKVRTAVLLLKNGKEVDDSIWRNYSRNPDLRTELYRQLQEIKRLDKFDPTYKNQEQMARAFVSLKNSMYTGLYGQQDNPDKDEKDSVVFICKKYVENKEGRGYVYFFKSRTGEKKDWYLSYNGYQPSDTSRINAEADVKEDFIRLDDDQKVDEEIARIMHRLALKGHRRTGNGMDEENVNRYYGDY